MTASARSIACAFRVMTPATPGAIGVIQLSGDVDGALDALGLDPVAPGAVGLRNLCDVDTGVVARWSARSAQLMPHGGAAVVRALANALCAAGLAPAESDDPVRDYPEAADAFEAFMLGALARAQSPLAIDALLAQPARWRAWDGADPAPARVAEVSRTLNRLIDPPLVVAVGRANVGKSTLANALADREVAVVADEPGTTRDHVGVGIDLAGLVVRWIDTPGLRDSVAQSRTEADAAAIARATVGSADLVALCADGASAYPTPADFDLGLGDWPAGRAIRVGTRADLGPARGADVSTAALTGAGLSELVRALRDRLMPPEALDWEGPWRFDGRLAGAALAL